jgi:UDP-N-acetylglucosamine 4,6-dehydratase
VGIRPGEKLHEVMVPEDDSRTTIELADRYVIQPAYNWVEGAVYPEAKPVADGFSYSSDKNDRWLSREELLQMIEPFRSGPPV